MLILILISFVNPFQSQHLLLSTALAILIDPLWDAIICLLQSRQDPIGSGDSLLLDLMFDDRQMSSTSLLISERLVVTGKF